MEDQPQAQRGYINASSLFSVPLYRPEDDARRWLETVERHGRVYGWSQEDRLNVARCRLGPEAQTWDAAKATRIHGWQAYKEEFLQ